MDYSTTFDAKLAIWTMDESLGKLSLPYDLVREMYVGDPTVGGKKVDRDSFAYQVRAAHDGYIESAIAELCDSLGKMKRQHITALSENSENWIVIGLLDKDFVEIHIQRELQDAMAVYRLNVSIVNRAKS